VYFAWDDVLQDHVERPLDDADPWTLKLARLINGRQMTDQEFALTLELVGGEYHPGG